MIIEQLAPNAYIINLSKPPDIVTVPVLRNDSFALTTVVHNIPDPFDLKVFNGFRCQVRPDQNSGKVLYEFPPSGFVLGKHESETMPEDDELNLWDPDGDLYQTCQKYDEVWTDIEAWIDEDEKTTIIQAELLIFPDITQYNNYLKSC